MAQFTGFVYFKYFQNAVGVFAEDRFPGQGIVIAEQRSRRRWQREQSHNECDYPTSIKRVATLKPTTHQSIL